MKLFLSIILSVYSVSPAMSETSQHCSFPGPIRYKMMPDAAPIRSALLSNSGYLKINADGSTAYLRSKLVEAPISFLLTLDKTGKITSLVLNDSSGIASLDKSTEELIRKTAPFKIKSSRNLSLVLKFGTSDLTVVAK